MTGERGRRRARGTARRPPAATAAPAATASEPQRSARLFRELRKNTSCWASPEGSTAAPGPGASGPGAGSCRPRREPPSGARDALPHKPTPPEDPGREMPQTGPQDKSPESRPCSVGGLEHPRLGGSVTREPGPFPTAGPAHHRFRVASVDHQGFLKTQQQPKWKKRQGGPEGKEGSRPPQPGPRRPRSQSRAQDEGRCSRENGDTNAEPPPGTPTGSGDVGAVGAAWGRPPPLKGTQRRTKKARLEHQGLSPSTSASDQPRGGSGRHRSRQV